jgi:hypothetical protein
MEIQRADVDAFLKMPPLSGILLERATTAIRWWNNANTSVEAGTGDTGDFASI